MLIWALPAWLGWALARVTVLAPYRLGYGTARVSGTAQGAGSEQKGFFCSEPAPFCRFLNKTLVFVQIRLERGTLRGQFREGQALVPRGAGSGSGDCPETSAGKKEGKFENERIKPYLYDMIKRRRNYE